MIIGIIGQGFVGGAVYHKFKNFYNVLTFDLDESKCNSNEDELINYLDWKNHKRKLSEPLFNLVNLLINLGSTNWYNDYEISLIYKILSNSIKRWFLFTNK